MGSFKSSHMHQQENSLFSPRVSRQVSWTLTGAKSNDLTAIAAQKSSMLAGQRVRLSQDMPSMDDRNNNTGSINSDPAELERNASLEAARKASSSD